MRDYIVTVRSAKRPDHDPQEKKTGPCPAAAECTDATGEHHSFLAPGEDAAAVRDRFRAQGCRVTRVELAAGPPGV